MQRHTAHSLLVDVHANTNLVILEPVADVDHKLPARIRHLWRLQLYCRDKIMLAPKIWDQSRELSVEVFVAQLAIRGLDHNVKLASAALDANETGLFSIMEMRRNAWDATIHLPLSVSRNASDAVLPRRKQNIKSLWCSVENHRSSLPFVHRDSEEVHVDNSVPVQVQTYVYVEVQRAHVCGHVQGHQKRPRFLKHLVHIMYVDCAGNLRLLWNSRVTARANVGQSDVLLGVLQHVRSLAEGQPHI